MKDDKQRSAAVCAALLGGLLLAAMPARAQFMGEPGGGPAQEGHRRGPAAPVTAAPAARLTPKPPPRQRLDAGALICPTEADLQRHAAAVEARLNGGMAPEPSGCRFVRSTVAVAVLDRHGPAATEVRLPGEPAVTGWTDAIVRGEAQPASN